MLEFVLEGKNCLYHVKGRGGPVVLWPSGIHDREDRKAMLRQLDHLTGDTPYSLLSFEVEQWNQELSPWPAPPVFGKAEFGGNGSATARWIMDTAVPWIRSYRSERDGSHEEFSWIIGGYSLAGLFSLWMFYETGCFDGVVSASGSLWFPGWQEYAATHRPRKGSAVYLSLGDKEEKTRNQTMAAVGRVTRWQAKLLEEDENIAKSWLVWNEGGHFSDPAGRMARGFGQMISALASECFFRGNHEKKIE